MCIRDREGTVRGPQYGTQAFEPAQNTEVVTVQFIRAAFWLFSVWTATLKNKHESTENSEVAFVCIYFF